MHDLMNSTLRFTLKVFLAYQVVNHIDVPPPLFSGSYISRVKGTDKCEDDMQHLLNKTGEVWGDVSQQ